MTEAEIEKRIKEAQAKLDEQLEDAMRQVRLAGSIYTETTRGLIAQAVRGTISRKPVRA